jgi:hypothetical protein
MNAVTKIVVCAECIREKLTADMRLVQNNSLHKTSDEKVGALDALYKKHKYVAGEFSSSTGIFGGNEMFFTGRICDVAYSIHIL